MERKNVIGEIIDYCEVNKIISYSELLEYCLNERYDWFRVLCLGKNTYIIVNYLKSKNHPG